MGSPRGNPWPAQGDQLGEGGQPVGGGGSGITLSRDSDHVTVADARPLS